MEIRDSEMSLVFFILYICKMKKLMKEKNQVVPDEVLSKYVYGKTCDLSDDDVYSFYGLKYIRLVTSIKLK